MYTRIKKQKIPFKFLRLFRFPFRENKQKGAQTQEKIIFLKNVWAFCAMKKSNFGISMKATKHHGWAYTLFCWIWIPWRPEDKKIDGKKKKKKKECLRTLDLHNLQVIKQEPKAIRYFGMDTFTRVYSRKKLCCLKYIA